MQLRALHIDLSDGSSAIQTHEVGPAPGPVQLAYALEGDPLVMGIGPLGDLDIPGSNRLVLAGRSPLWEGFFVSTIGSAGAPLRALGLDAIVLRGQSDRLSALIIDGSERIRLEAVDAHRIWDDRGVYGLLRFVRDARWTRERAPRVLGVGPAAASTWLGAIASSVTRPDAPVVLDTWAGRGGFGSRLTRRHGLVAVVIDAPADAGRHDSRSPAMLDPADVRRSVQKYRYHPLLKTGGTLGSNLTTLREKLLAFNDRTMFWPAQRRLQLHTEWIERRYLAQFNASTQQGRRGRDCGETCPAVCKKVSSGLKKDYQPYAALGPHIGVFDQSAAEHAADTADALGFDAIEAGALVAWAFDCVDGGVLSAEDLGLSDEPHWQLDGFDPETDSLHNAHQAAYLLHAVAFGGAAVPPIVDAMRDGLWRATRAAGERAAARATFSALGTRGAIAPNHYWTPGIVAPVPIPGKYYTDYSLEFAPPRELGRRSARRFIRELALDNLGMCRFQREWAEDRLPELLHAKDASTDTHSVWRAHAQLAAAIAHQQEPHYWQTDRTIARVTTYLREAQHDDPKNTELAAWVRALDADESATARRYFDDFRAGLIEALDQGAATS